MMTQSPWQTPLLVWDYLWLLGRGLIHFAEQVLQLRSMSHQLVVYPVSFVQECIDVGNSLDRKTGTCVKAFSGFP